MKILITGGVGFIGGHLARSLASEGHDVTLLDNFRRGVQDPFIESCVNDFGIKVLKVDHVSPNAAKHLISRRRSGNCRLHGDWRLT